MHLTIYCRSKFRAENSHGLSEHRPGPLGKQFVTLFSNWGIPRQDEENLHRNVGENSVNNGSVKVEAIHSAARSWENPNWRAIPGGDGLAVGLCQAVRNQSPPNAPRTKPRWKMQCSTEVRLRIVFAGPRFPRGRRAWPSAWHQRTDVSQSQPRDFGDPKGNLLFLLVWEENIKEERRRLDTQRETLPKNPAKLRRRHNSWTEAT